MDKVICIVGGGAASIAFLDNFLAQLKDSEGFRYTIYVVEKNRSFGPGQAYNDDLDSNILNTKTGYLTIFPERQGHFHQWLNDHSEAWQWKYPNFEPAPDSYAPRPLFGQYLQHCFATVVNRGVRDNVKIIPVHAEVLDLLPVGSGYSVETACNIKIKADYVFLLCGNLENASQHTPKMESGIISNPYPVFKLSSFLNKEKSVAILGSRLSAIDAVIALKEAGHKGQIVMYSRSGHFPSVRGAQGRFETYYMTPEYLKSIGHLRGKLTLNHLAKMVGADVELFHERHPGQPREDLVIPGPVTDLAEFLEKEIALAKHARAWQAVLYATNAIVEELWEMLTEEDRKVFREKYLSAFLSYRVSIPSENAEKIYRYLRDGELTFIQGPTTAEEIESGKVMVTSHNSNEEKLYDYLVLATGSPKRFANSSSPLLKALENRGCVTAHPNGGMEVDRETYSVINKHGQASSQIFALGEITAGKFFFMSALDIICRHATKCARVFYEDHCDIERREEAVEMRMNR